MHPILLTGVFFSSLALGADAVIWDFEDSSISWRGRADTVKVTRVAGPGAIAGSAGFLRIFGAINVGYNYALSDQRPMTAGGLYRLSAQVRVNRVGPGTPMPFLKCEFVAADRNVAVGRVNTNPYDASKMGQWQELSCEFKAPPQTVAFWLALEKGTDGAAEIEADLDNVIVEPIRQLSAIERYRLKPTPQLEAVRGVHPRLFLNPQKLEQLRQAIQTTHKALWEEVRAQADGYVKKGPPAYIEQDSYSAGEQLWQREVGNAMPFVAICYLLTGEQKYLDSARAWALASCSYPTWGLGSTDSMDLAAGHQLLGLATIYDWCYQGLGEDARRTIRETLIQRAGRMFEGAVSGKAWWTRSYLQNHLWVSVCGLGAAGLALFDEVDDALLWVGLAQDKFRRTNEVLGPDGASHEGVGYWGYGVEYMLKFMALDQELLGEDLHDRPWWRNTAFYRLYMALPRQAWTARNNIVDIADCPRSNWYGPDYLLRRLATLFRDGHAQWLANEIDAANVDSPSARWLNLLWYDPTVPPQPPTDLPTLRHFEDLGIVSARSDWSGTESLVVFKCGPPLGHAAAVTLGYDAGAGHVHPDANHFVVFADGEWLIRDDGYLAKATSQHNTLLIDGKGQIGEGSMWFRGSDALKAGALPKILRAASTPQLDYIVGDATSAYPSASGLKRYVRRLLFLKPDVLIVVDDIATDGARDLELRFHPEQQTVQQQGNAFTMIGKGASLRLVALTPEGVTLSSRHDETTGQHGKAGAPLFSICLNTRRDTWRNAVALSWALTGEEPPEVTLERREDRLWQFRVGNRTAVLNWEDLP
jgi:hypothetical protein